MSNQELVPTGPVTDWFAAMSEFYRAKYLVDRNAPIFSSFAAEHFPDAWLASFQSGIWTEEGQYGDNFRKFFNLAKS